MVDKITETRLENLKQMFKNNTIDRQTYERLKSKYLHKDSKRFLKRKRESYLRRVRSKPEYSHKPEKKISSYKSERKKKEENGSTQLAIIFLWTGTLIFGFVIPLLFLLLTNNEKIKRNARLAIVVGIIIFMINFFFPFLFIFLSLFLN